MTVVGFQSKPATMGWLIGDFKKKRPAAIPLLGQLALNDTYLVSYFNPFITDTRTYMPTPLYDELLTRLELLVMQKAFVPEYTFGSLQVRVKNTETEFPKGLDIVRGPNLFKIDTKIMRIKARVIVKASTGAEAYRWDLGFIQTVTRLERKVVFQHADGRVHYRSWIDSPHKDGPRGNQTIWFDPNPNLEVVKQLDDEFIQEVTVEIKDMPGFNLSSQEANNISSVSGGEAFRTWLALRKRDGSQVNFIRMWEWHVDYTLDPDNVPRWGIVFDGYQPNANGVGAALTGLTTKDAMKSETREEKVLVTRF